MSGDTVINGARGLLPAVAALGLAASLYMARKLAWTDVQDWLPHIVHAVAILAFAGLGLLVWLKPTRLRLTATGFRHEPMIGRARAVAWRDIEELRAWTVRRSNSLPGGSGGRWIAWSWRRPVRAGSPLSLSTTDGVIGAIPGQWSLPVGEIIALMHERLEASGA